MFKIGDIVKFTGYVNTNFGPENPDSLGEVTRFSNDGVPTFYLVKWRGCLAKHREGRSDAWYCAEDLEFIDHKKEVTTTSYV